MTAPHQSKKRETSVQPARTNVSDVLRRIYNFCKANPASRVYQAALIVSG